MLGGIILSYNNPELTKHCFRSYENLGIPLNVFDNGSDGDKISGYTSHAITDNRRIAGGWNAAVKAVLRDNKYKYIWLITNDAIFGDGDVNKIVNFMDANPEVGMVHPALTHDSPTGWSNMLRKPDNETPRPEWMIDIIAPIIRVETWERCNGFDASFSRGWGMDWDFAYHLYSNGYVAMVDDRVFVRHLLGGTYRSGKADEPEEIRNMNAIDEAETYLSKRYGTDWREIIELHNRKKISQYVIHKSQRESKGQ